MLSNLGDLAVADLDLAKLKGISKNKINKDPKCASIVIASLPAKRKYAVLITGVFVIKRRGCPSKISMSDKVC